MPNPQPGRKLRLQDYLGQDIPNSVDPDPSPNIVALAREGHPLLLRAVRELRPPTGRYNCHGLVFASRRTNIPPLGLPDAVDLWKLLQSDQYDRFPQSTAQVGDVAVYVAPAGEIDHTGIVTRIEVVGQTRVPYVWSMWGGLGEFEHRAEQTPYRDCEIQYWRLIP